MESNLLGQLIFTPDLLAVKSVDWCPLRPAGECILSPSRSSLHQHIVGDGEIEARIREGTLRRGGDLIVIGGIHLPGRIDEGRDGIDRSRGNRIP
jgi:hypothetical protein